MIYKQTKTVRESLQSCLSLLGYIAKCSLLQWISNMLQEALNIMITAFNNFVCHIIMTLTLMTFIKQSQL